jgi:hypothetical protein
MSKKSFTLFLMIVICVSLTACGQQSPTSSINTSTTTVKKSTEPTIAKTCATPAPTLSEKSAVNASGLTVNMPQIKLSTSDVAWPLILAEAKKWSADAETVGNFVGQGNPYYTGTPQRVHYAAERGATWAWGTTFYSPSKKANLNVSYIDGEVGSSPAFELTSDTIEMYKKYPSIYQDYNPMISSCVVYEIAKQNGLDDQKNYYTIRSMASDYSDQFVWVLEERSRTDDDAGKEVMGKIMHSYIIDALTGEVLKITDGKVH